MGEYSWRETRADDTKRQQDLRTQRFNSACPLLMNYLMLAKHSIGCVIGPSLHDMGYALSADGPPRFQFDTPLAYRASIGSHRLASVANTYKIKVVKPSNYMSFDNMIAAINGMPEQRDDRLPWLTNTIIEIPQFKLLEDMALSLKKKSQELFLSMR